MIKLQKEPPKSSLKTLINYCVDENTPQTKAFLSKEGIKVFSKEEAKKELMMYVGAQTKKGNGKNALQKLFDLHPDKDLILEFFGKKKENLAIENYEFSGAETSKTPLIQSQTAKIAIVIAIVIALIFIIYQFD